MASQAAQIPQTLAGRRIAVVIAGCPLGGRLTAALAQRGASVVLLDDSAPNSTFPHFPADFSSRSSVENAFAAAEATLGGIDLVVHAALPEAVLQPRSIADSSDDDWEAACEAALDASLHTLQAAYGFLARSAGVVVQIGPSLALFGANGLVALTTAAEAQRGLLKSVARQWGVDGIRLHWIGAYADQLSPLLAVADLPKKSEAIPVPLNRRPQLETDIVAMIVSLAGEAGDNLTGLTLNLDGGEWMLP